MREMEQLLNAKKYNELKEFISMTTLESADALKLTYLVAGHGNIELFEYVTNNIKFRNPNLERSALFYYNFRNILKYACKNGNIAFIKYLLDLDVFGNGKKKFDRDSVIDDALACQHISMHTQVLDFFASKFNSIKCIDFVCSVRSANLESGNFAIVKHIDDKYYEIFSPLLFAALSIQGLTLANTTKAQEYHKYKSFIAVVEPLYKKYKSMLTPGLDLAIGFAETLFALNTPTVLPCEVQCIVLELMLQQMDCSAARCRGYVDKELSFAEYDTRRLWTEMALTAEELTGKKINEIVKF